MAFIANYLFNLLMFLLWSIPGWILLALHFLLDTPLWWALVFLGIWMIMALIPTIVMSMASNTESKNDPKNMTEEERSQKKAELDEKSKKVGEGFESSSYDMTTMGANTIAEEVK